MGGEGAHYMNAQTPPLKRTPQDVIRALAAGAREKLADIAFTEACLDLEKQWFGELMATDDPDTERALKAQIRAIAAVVSILKSMSKRE